MLEELDDEPVSDMRKNGASMKSINDTHANEDSNSGESIS